jgi:hypothetical protein
MRRRLWGFGFGALAVVDTVGGWLAWNLGITSPKFQYVIDEVGSIQDEMRAEVEAEKKAMDEARREADIMADEMERAGEEADVEEDDTTAAIGPEAANVVSQFKGDESTGFALTAESSA